MCEWGTGVEVDNLLAFNGEWHRRTWKIDSCIAPMVKALNDGGVETVASCCGHGKAPGRIDLVNGILYVYSSDDLDAAGLERAYQVAKTRLGTRRSTTVKEIINAYLGGGP